MNNVCLRDATIKDELLVFEWRNIENLVALSSKQKKVTFEEHKEWFKKKIKNSKCRILIIQLKNKNIDTKFIEGLRVTDKDTVKVVEDVLANEINAEIVKSINESGGKAIGLSGNKNTLLSASKLKIEIKDSDSNIEKLVDIGFVGQPTKVNTNFIQKHIRDGNIPVIAPLGIDDKGNSYNINADTAAGFIAGELEASKLLLLTDVPGILDQDKKLISSLTLDDASKIIDEDFIVGGMKPKILTCVEAMKKGVNKTTILDGRIPHSVVLELFTEHGIGTQIYS